MYTVLLSSKFFLWCFTNGGGFRDLVTKSWTPCGSCPNLGRNPVDVRELLNPVGVSLYLPGDAVYIYSVILNSINGVSSTKDVRVTCISLQTGDIKSVKFVDEENRLLMLWSDPSFSTHLLSLPLDPIPQCTSEQEIQLRPADATGGINIPWDQQPSSVVQIDLLDPAADGGKGWILHSFDDDGLDGEGPVSLEVNPLKGRRAICVLYADGMRYEVLDMDNAVQDDEGGGEEL